MNPSFHPPSPSVLSSNTLQRRREVTLKSPNFGWGVLGLAGAVMNELTMEAMTRYFAAEELISRV